MQKYNAIVSNLYFHEIFLESSLCKATLLIYTTGQALAFLTFFQVVKAIMKIWLIFVQNIENNVSLIIFFFNIYNTNTFIYIIIIIIDVVTCIFSVF